MLSKTFVIDMALKYATITLIIVVLLTRDSSIHWDRSRQSVFAALAHTDRTGKRKNAFEIRKTKAERYYYIL